MVHFVGAGPGAVDLITVRGMELLKKADTVIYAGSLVNRDLLNYCKSDAEIYNSAHMVLDEVIEVIQKAEKDNHETVRLHTGDASIYGAIREQMDELDRLGIKYDSCPGVSAAFGAASTLNLEYTLPGISQSLIITRMAGRTDVPQRENIRSFAEHQASMAIYLSTGQIEELTKELIAGGYSENTPAALVYKATWPEEKALVGTIGSLRAMAQENDITKTAIILVGDVIGTPEYELSKLYSPDFSTEYREAKKSE